MRTENGLADHLSTAAATAEGGRTFLGEDWAGWQTALIAAVVAALAYEAFLAVLRMLKPRVARFMTLRLPFLLLASARLTVSAAAWNELHQPMKADLWDILEDDQRGTARRFVAGLAFSASLVFGGALRTARALSMPKPEKSRPAHRPRETSRRARRLALGTAVVLALAGMNGPWMYTWFSQANWSARSTILIAATGGELLFGVLTLWLGIMIFRFTARKKRQ